MRNVVRSVVGAAAAETKARLNAACLTKMIPSLRFQSPLPSSSRTPTNQLHPPQDLAFMLREHEGV